MRRYVSSGAAALLFTILSTQSLYAATLDCTGFNSNGQSPTVYELGHATIGICVDGKNPSNYVTSTTSIFGMTGWSLENKLDANGSGSDFDFGKGTAGANSAKSGKISADLKSFEHAFIALKAGNAFGAFKVETSDAMWNWKTSKGISNVSVWTKGTATPPAPVPLPAAGILLLAGLGALGFGRRFGKSRA